jgi:hypothetical protein
MPEIQLHDFTQADWDLFQNGRVTIAASHQQKHEHDARFVFPLQMRTLLSHNKNVFVTDFVFTNCVYLWPVDIGSYEQAGKIIFKGCVFEAKVTISTTENVEFENCSFKNDLTISQVTQFKYGNLSIGGKFWISTNSSQSLTLENITVSDGKEMLVIANNIGLRLENCKLPILQITGPSNIDGHLVIEDSKIEQIKILAANIEIGLYISGSEISKFKINQLSRISQELKIEDSKIAEIEFPLSSFQETVISRSNLGILNFTKTNKKEDVLILESLNVGAIVFDNILNEGQFSLRGVNIAAGGKIRVISSNIGKMDFILCNFKSAQLEFENSKMTEVFVSETEFPKRAYSNGRENHAQAQLAFGQISAAFQKQGDTVRALEYQAREIEAHYKQLRFYDREERKFSFTKISLWLNKWSNDFGRSWQRGLLFSLGVGFMFFCFVVMSADEFGIGIPAFDSRLFIAYVRFMNPLRFFELETIFKLNGEESFLTLTSWSYFLDFLGRVFVAYGFYQTIQAFRRYGRK